MSNDHGFHKQAQTVCAQHLLHMCLATAYSAASQHGYQIWLPAPAPKALVAKGIGRFGYQLATVAIKISPDHSTFTVAVRRLQCARG
jgi:hypothetical protein